MIRTKKILGIFMTAAITISNVSGTLAADEHTILRKDAVEKIVKVLYETDTIQDFDFSMNYCIHATGSAHFVPVDQTYPIMCELYNSIEPIGFDDVSVEDERAIFVSIAKTIGFVTGCGSNTFEPDRPVTYHEAVKMVVSALGFDSLAQDNGGYPNGYLVVANNYEFLKDIELNNDSDYISQENLQKLLNNCFYSTTFTNVKRSDFMVPKNAEECVTMYADAVKNRNGVVQYALMDDALRESMRQDFISFNWVTGVSSPWVTSYDIEQIDDVVYKILFHYATSTGNAGDSEVLLTLNGYAENCRITEIHTEDEQ